MILHHSFKENGFSSLLTGLGSSSSRFLFFFSCCVIVTHLLSNLKYAQNSLLSTVIVSNQCSTELFGTDAVKISAHPKFSKLFLQKKH